MTSSPLSGNRRILFIDDDEDFLTVLKMSVRGVAGLEATTASSAEEGLEKLEHETLDIVVTDLNLPGGSGMEFVATARARGFRVPILVLTAHGSVEGAVEALRLGAADFLQKPVDPARLCALVETLLADAPPILRVDPARPPVRDASGESAVEGFLGVSPAMRAVFERIDRVAQTDATVLIVGESGTGKELVARAIHQRSKRARGPLVPVHTGAIPRDLIASELFGHEKGSFTGAVAAAEGKFDAAAGGTLFLDEIGTMQPAVQVSLLRVLETFKYTRVGGRQERNADVRVVAATNRDLLEMVGEGTFREDLYYRLNVFTVALPPLRDRPEDLALIAQHYLAAFAARYHMPARRFSRGALDRLHAHAWPGNVRELRNVMEQTVVFARGEEVQEDELQLISTHIAQPAARTHGTAVSAESHTVSQDSHGRQPIAAASTPLPSHAASHTRVDASPEATPFVESPAAAADSRSQARAGFDASMNARPGADIRMGVGRDGTLAAAARQGSPGQAAFAAQARQSLGAVAASYDDDALVLHFPLGTTVEEVEKQLLIRTLDVLGGNKQRAARVLGISRRCLYNKLETYGMGTARPEALAEDPAELVEPARIEPVGGTA